VAEHYRSALALSDGRLADAERAAERSRAWSRLLTGRDASGVYGIQMFGIRREQGRLSELAPVVRVLADGERVGGEWRPGFAALLAELGMVDAAREQLTLVRRAGLDSLRESLWLGSLTYLSDACAVVGDAGLARAIYAELEPMAGTNVMIGHGVASYGSADRYLGMLAATFGALDPAVDHLISASAHNRRMGARTWLAHSRYQLGRALRLRAGPGDAQQAAEALSEAAELAEAIGMPALLARIRALGVGTSGGAELPDDLSPREVEILRLVARGLSNRAIGLQLLISEHTAANHVRSILRKTGCANRTEAATYAHRQGLTGVESGR
jgi:DNA-binding CsgD family transcriptional regulator